MQGQYRLCGSTQKVVIKVGSKNVKTLHLVHLAHAHNVHIATEFVSYLDIPCGKFLSYLTR